MNRGLNGSRSGFTLIELLVVIAIIAILAAILFPVFAQAREKARATSCLSNVKQVATAYYMYTEDFDEYTPCIAFDWWYPVYPYFKDYKLLNCPDRNDYGGINAWPSARPTDTCLSGTPDGTGNCNNALLSGYAYNWGPLNSRGGGLTGLKQNGVAPGISISQIVSPAQMFAFGDSYDTPRMNLGMFTEMCTFNGTSQAAMRTTASGTLGPEDALRTALSSVPIPR